MVIPAQLDCKKTRTLLRKPGKNMKSKRKITAASHPYAYARGQKNKAHALRCGDGEPGVGSQLNLCGPAWRGASLEREDESQGNLRVARPGF